MKAASLTRFYLLGRCRLRLVLLEERGKNILHSIIIYVGAPNRSASNIRHYEKHLIIYLFKKIKVICLMRFNFN